RQGPPKSEATPAAPGRPWNVVVDRAALRDGHLRLRDYVVEPPEPVELVLAALELKSFSFQYGNDREPGHGVIEARFADGTVRVETTVTTRSDGFAVDARVEVTNLPLARRPSAAGGTPPAPPPEGAPPAPWTWSVGKVDVTDTLVKVFLEPPPLEIRIVKAAVTDLSSATGSSATIALELREGEGTIA